MSTPPISINYHFSCGDGREIHFDVALDPDTLEHRFASISDPPPWTRLEHEQCKGCMLNRDEHSHCPAALSLVELVDLFGALQSYDEVDVTVTTEKRKLSAHTSVQKALSSLIGLHMATSGCPSMTFFRPMARFHLPFATKDETLFRAAGAYLIAQYFHNVSSNPCDWSLKGLQEAYEMIHEVNVGMASRIRLISESDANLNAIVVLDLFAHELPYAIGEKLSELKYLFKPYFEAREKGLATGPA
ncbi:MAG: hypothetical protein HYV27_09755 [Candidatus Hydrogenedentes bacterium]|nr:hypothetical protein [Candidatus Hydrogenedentota bacterium]